MASRTSGGLLTRSAAKKAGGNLQVSAAQLKAIASRKRRGPPKQPEEEQPGQQPDPLDQNFNQPERLGHVYVQLTDGVTPVFAACAAAWHPKYGERTVIPLLSDLFAVRLLVVQGDKDDGPVYITNKAGWFSSPLPAQPLPFEKLEVAKAAGAVFPHLSQDYDTWQTLVLREIRQETYTLTAKVPEDEDMEVGEGQADSQPGAGRAKSGVSALAPSAAVAPAQVAPAQVVPAAADPTPMASAAAVQQAPAPFDRAAASAAVHAVFDARIGHIATQLCKTVTGDDHRDNAFSALRAVVSSMRTALDSGRNYRSKDMIVTFAENIFRDYYLAWEKVALRMDVFTAYVGSTALGSMKNALLREFEATPEGQLTLSAILERVELYHADTYQPALLRELKLQRSFRAQQPSQSAATGQQGRGKGRGDGFRERGPRGRGGRSSWNSEEDPTWSQGQDFASGQGQAYGQDQAWGANQGWGQNQTWGASQNHGNGQGQSRGKGRVMQPNWNTNGRGRGRY